jgi:hypothetical protein
MRRATSCFAVIMLAGCSGETSVSEADISNRATAIVEAANATVAAQIAEIEQRSAEDGVASPNTEAGINSTTAR